MDIAAFLIDFILHVDRHLSEFVAAYGAWVYALLFVIIFVETGVVVMPFLPGDSLLFVVGALCGAGLMSLPLSIGLLIAAGVGGGLAGSIAGLASVSTYPALVMVGLPPVSANVTNTVASTIPGTAKMMRMSCSASPGPNQPRAPKTST